jgi:hypothetical protein
MSPSSWLKPTRNPPNRTHSSAAACGGFYSVIAVEDTLFGTSYVVEGSLTAPDGRSRQVRVVWFIETGESIPHLVTAYPLKGMRDD